MARPFHHLLLTGTLGLLAGCATPPLILDSSHPASMDAPEAATKPARSSLRSDEATRRTRELLKQREEQATAAESTPTTQPSKQGHEHH
ncbi:MAG TPA: hypothetical protein VFD27_16825 [Chthoniobacteraceae bacterium]|nr:hypothetical protein [Chthoniobacteraceae bacterium]